MVRELVDLEIVDRDVGEVGCCIDKLRATNAKQVDGMSVGRRAANEDNDVANKAN